MPDMIYKVFRPEVKEVDTKEGLIDMLIPMSTASMDREGEAIDPQGWKKSLPAFKKRPVLLSSHNYGDLRKQIGEFTQLRVTDDGLFAKPKYYINEGNEEADWAFKLASKGMAAYSVGFIPKEYEDGDGQKTPRRTYTQMELLEISHVVVPSNREAIQGLRGKSANPVINGVIEDIINAPVVDLTGEAGIVTKPETTAEYYRVPVPGEEGKHEGHQIRTIDVSAEKGIKALYCVEDKKIITYLFDKSMWESMGECQAWMKDHMKKASQAEISDEIDYLRHLVATVGLNASNKPQAAALAADITKLLRDSGGDTPVDDNPVSTEVEIPFVDEIMAAVKRIAVAK